MMTGMPGAGLFVYGVITCIRVRARSKSDRLDPRTAQFLFTVANGLLTSMTDSVGQQRTADCVPRRKLTVISAESAPARQ